MANPADPIATPSPGVTETSPGASGVAAAPTTPPVAAAPVSAPVAETPVVAPVAVEPAPVAAAVEPVAEKPATSLLSQPSKTEEIAKPVETPVVEAKPAEPAPLPTYEPFKLPEGTPEGQKLDEARVGEFTKVLGEFENGPRDHASTQALGQKLVDFHLAELGNTVKTINDANQQSWNAMREKWVASVREDPQMGRNQLETTLSRANDMIEQYGGTPEQKTELREAFALTGMGDHPALIRFISNVSKVLGEPSKTAVGIPKSPALAPKSTRRYGNNPQSLNGNGAA